MHEKRCRFCGDFLKHTFVDLGMSPLSNAFIKPELLKNAEHFYPLQAFICEKCFLVQLEEFEKPEEIFSDYAYFSSFSDSWLKHAERFTCDIINKYQIKRDAKIIEIASNDGYLLQFFKKKGFQVLGIEPAKNVAKEAEKKDIPTLTDFFGANLAKRMVTENLEADLLIGNNVLAHVPDLNDFVSGMKLLLKPGGIITMEFPHLFKLIESNQFDTIYHEHFSYFSLITVKQVFEKHGLSIFDVEELSTHGGSLRVYAKHFEDETKKASANVGTLLEQEMKSGLNMIETYLSFSERVKRTKRNILNFLIERKNENKTIAGYGAPAKGNTLLNYCGIRTDFIDYTVDKSPHKQNLYLPGIHIPVFSPDKIKETKPDYLIILPWNLKEEIVQQMKYIRDWGGKFVTLIPDVEVF